MGKSPLCDMHIITLSRISSHLSRFDYCNPSCDLLIDITVPCGTGFLRRVKRPTAVRSAYIYFLVVLAPADRHWGARWI